jgi:hypothetical protein
MAAAKTGERVRVIEREVTPDDVKSGLYYAYFAGLTGMIDRTYDDGSVCVDVDLESLTEEMRTRHISIQEGERKRWLDNLSDEARNRLTAEQKQFKMNYRVLVSGKDLEPHKGGKPGGESNARQSEGAGAAPESGGKGASSTAQSGEPKAQAGQPEPRPETRPPKEDDSPKRLSEAELSAAEEEFLKSRQPGN